MSPNQPTSDDASRMMLDNAGVVDADADLPPGLLDRDSDSDDDMKSSIDSSMWTTVCNLIKCKRCCWSSRQPAAAPAMHSGNLSPILDSAVQTPTVGDFLLGAPFTLATSTQMQHGKLRVQPSHNDDGANPDLSKRCAPVGSGDALRLSHARRRHSDVVR
jgi:hypothetical protein